MNPFRSRLIDTLIKNQGSYVSGGVLSEKLGTSRVSIKNYVDQLNGAGFTIEAVRNRGYCLREFPVALQEDAFRHFLGDKLPNSQVLVFENIDSTNMELDRRLNAGEPAPLVSIAGTQSRGKGRRGNQWVSSNGENLYLSLGFRPNIPLARIGQYTLWLGMQLASLLRERLALEVLVKWPNDLYLGGKKLAGILTEAKIDTDHVQHLIVGLGLNINANVDEFPADVRSKATSLRREKGKILNFNELAAEVSRTLLEASELYFLGSRESEIRERWPEFDFLYGKQVRAKSFSGVVEGIATGIDERGELQIRLKDNSLCAVNSGEVTMAFD